MVDVEPEGGAARTSNELVIHARPSHGCAERQSRGVSTLLYQINHTQEGECTLQRRGPLPQVICHSALLDDAYCVQLTQLSFTHQVRDLTMRLNNELEGQC